MPCLPSLVTFALFAVSSVSRHRIHIIPQQEGGKFYIKCKGGTKDAKDAKDRVQQLVATIQKEEVLCHKPGM